MIWMLLILFGLSGSGKNFVGDILQKHFSYYHWDADVVLPHDMRLCIQQKTHFTQDMRDRFATIISANISALKMSHKKLVISQGLYKEKNRDDILKAHPDAKFILIQADEDKIISRLKETRGMAQADYAAIIQKNFETPLNHHGVLVNNTGSQDVVKHAQEIFIRLTP
jgi:gluconokinase